MNGIIYDMDGVIALTEDMHKKAFNKTMETYGVQYEDMDWGKFIGRGNKAILTEVFADYYISENVHEWVLKWVANYQQLVKTEGVTVVPGFLKFDRGLLYKKIIATGGLRKNSEIILNLLNLNYGIISSEDLINPKPDPEIFIKASKSINVPYNECTVFEDSIHGIRAAKSAGMRVVALTTTFTREEIEAESPDLIIDNFINFNYSFFNKRNIIYPQFEER